MNIQINDLRYTYRRAQIEDRTVLEIPQWVVETGTHLLLRGISGSGKTTLLNILAGLLPPTHGRVRIGTEEIYTLSEAMRDRFRAQSIGYVFQNHLLVPTLNAAENVEMPLVFAGVTRGDQRRRALEMLERVGLANFARHRPVQLSTGQRVRVAVARALVNRPQILIADEPTAALDGDNASVIMDLMQERARADGSTLIIASHDPGLAARFDRTCDLQMGQLVDDAPTHASPPTGNMTGGMNASELSRPAELREEQRWPIA